jgi:hypothetical protein
MQYTANTRAFIEAEQYSQFILLNLHDGLLPETFYRNVSDFASGTNLHIKTVGTVTVQDAEEDAPLVYSPIDTGEVQLHITNYKGDAWYVTDDLREDGAEIEQLMAQRSAESTRAIQEVFESDFLAIGANYFVSNTGPQNINGFPHCIVSAMVGGVAAMKHFVSMRLAFDKAQVPSQGRIAIVDPLVEATLNGYVQLTSNITPFAQGILERGIASGQRFLFNLFGWDIITSNRLLVSNYNDGTTTGTGYVGNLFMNILDDNTKPIMAAWRRMPKSEGERNKDRARDEFVVRCRYGFGIQRLDTLGLLATSAVNFAPDKTHDNVGT